jgi:DNA-binding response OmpR family regulator
VARATVAVIEDDPAVAELLGELLADAGYLPCRLNGDVTTLEELAAARPALVILDLLLGNGRSGWDYLRQIRQHDLLREVPVLICSADLTGLRERKGQLQTDPRVASLVKPFRIEELEATVAGLIEGQRVPVWDEERDLVLIADASARLVDASAAALRLLRMSADELRGLGVAEIVAHAREWTVTEWQRYLADGRWEGPVTLRAKDGGTFPARSVAEVFQALGQTWHLSRLQVAPIEMPLGESPAAGSSSM